MKYLPPRGVFQKGLSLSEILVALSISAILAISAIPDLSGMLMDNRAATLTNSLLTAMQVARTEAIKRNSEVTLCKSTGATGCTGTWTDGWIVFSDLDADRKLDTADGEELVMAEQLTGTGFTITWNGFRSDNYIQFGPQGFIHSNNGTFTLCPLDRNNRHARAIIVNRLGRARASKDNDHDGIHEDGYGRPVDCS